MTDQKETIQFADFAKLDLRIGRVMAAVIPEWSEKLIELTVDFGAEIGQKTILAGVKEWYQPADLINQNFIFVVNLAERKMGPGVSQGMMIAAEDEARAVLLPAPLDLPAGTPLR